VTDLQPLHFCGPAFRQYAHEPAISITMGRGVRDCGGGWNGLCLCCVRGKLSHMARSTTLLVLTVLNNQTTEYKSS